MRSSIPSCSLCKMIGRSLILASLSSITCSLWMSHLLLT
jgi:hypothetical protein